MPRCAVDGIELEYETFGDPSDPALLLVMGLGAQLIAWDERFCRLLADGGRYVIRFDNRDVGLSTHLDGAAVNLGRILRRLVVNPVRSITDVPYTLLDMAVDGVAVLDHVGVERAHVVGASMGGMIAQLVAAKYPDRVLTLTSIMSTTGERAYGQPTPAAMQRLLTPVPTDRDGYVDHSVASWRVFAPHRHFDAELVERRAAAAFDRAFYPEGFVRQLAALLTAESRAGLLSHLATPTLVIHGRQDTLVQPSGGIRTAELIPGARFLLMGDMGHDLPVPHWPFTTSVILAHTDTMAPGR